MKALEALKNARDEAQADIAHLTQTINNRYAELERLRSILSERHAFVEDCNQTIARLERECCTT